MRRGDINQNQQGVVAIFSVLVIMGLLTLLTLGFSGMTRQAQRRALDDHLSSQAYYAAEAGVNIATGIADPNLPNISTCQGITDASLGARQRSLDIVADQGIEVTCLLINPTPSDLEFDKVPILGQGEPAFGLIESTVPSENIETLDFYWDSTTMGAGIPSGFPSLIPSTTWGDNVGIMRVDLVAGNNVVDRATLTDSQSYSIYLYPSNTTDTDMNITDENGLGGHGHLIRANCNGAGAYRCHASIDVTGAPVYRVRMTSYYNESTAQVIARNASAAPMTLKHGQAEIDSTGKAGDVLRRIRVRIPLSFNKGLHEPFSIFGGQGICKQYISGPNFYSNEAGPTDNGICDVGP